MSSPQWKARVIECRTRRLKIRKDMLNGLCNVTELAARYGVSAPTIVKDMRWVQEQWRREDARLFHNDVARRRRQRVAMLLENIRKAANSFEMSQEHREEVTVESRQRKCLGCNGSGTVGSGKSGSECPACKGSGIVDSVIEKRGVKTTAGDASFLRVINDSLKQISMLEGNFPATNQNVNIQGVVGVVAVDPKLAAADDEQILAAYKSVERIGLSGSPLPALGDNTIEGRVLETTKPKTKRTKNNAKDSSKKKRKE